jgi:hypothetical protein
MSEFRVHVLLFDEFLDIIIIKIIMISRSKIINIMEMI